MNNLRMDVESLDILNVEIENIINNIEDLYNDMDKDIISLKDEMSDSLFESFNNIYSQNKVHFNSVVEQLKSHSVFLSSSIDNYEKRDNSIYNDIEKNVNKLTIN